MNCPDCGSKLVEQPSAAGVMVRCFKCGGFWLDAGTANNLTATELAAWRRISVSTSYLSGGKGVCPADGQRLERYQGEQIPQNVVVQRCGRCGRWWFPGDNLYRFKPALEAKKNYFRLWGLPLARGVLLPLAVAAVLTGGLAAGVSRIGQTRQTGAVAREEITEFSAVYSGGGRGMAVFKSAGEVEKVEYKEAGRWSWQKANVEMKNGYYVAWLEGLTEGKEYVVRTGGKEYRFTAR